MPRGSLYLLAAVICGFSAALAVAIGDVYGVAIGASLSAMNFFCYREDRR